MAFRNKTPSDMLMDAISYLGCLDKYRCNKPGEAYSKLPTDIKDKIKDLKSNDLQNHIVWWGEPNSNTTSVFRMK